MNGNVIRAVRQVEVAPAAPPRHDHPGTLDRAGLSPIKNPETVLGSRGRPGRICPDSRVTPIQIKAGSEVRRILREAPELHSDSPLRPRATLPGRFQAYHPPVDRGTSASRPAVDSRKSPYSSGSSG